MDNQKQVDHLKRGVDGWNRWRRNHPTESIDLSNADLSNTDLRGAKLSLANLRYTDLNYANLKGTDLNHANLSHANLRHADLYGANLYGANLYKANLILANLIDANLINADFTNAIMDATSLGNRDLSFIKGLETVEHRGPSPLSINTIYHSQGDIPEAFVRGTGAPDSFLDYMKALASKPIEYYTCFLSYSSHDEAFANRLYADLQHNGVRCWFAPEDMKIGDKIRSRIDESIRLYDKLLLVLSESSITSNWVEYEVEAALAKERRENRTMLFPVRLDDDIKQSATAWAAHIQDTRHIGNFSHWKDHDAYQQAFTRLLRDLKADHKR